MQSPSIIIRIDDRLIHGQILVGWCSQIPIKKFVISDDEIASDEWQKNFITMDSGTDKEVEILSAPEACHYIRQHLNTDKTTMLLVRSPFQIKKMADIDLPIKEINIGGIHYREGRNEYLLYLFLSDEEVAIFKELMKRGFVFVCQDLPTNTRYDLDKILERKNGKI